MSLKNITKGQAYPIKIYKADNLISRLIGWLGTEGYNPHQALQIVPCNGIHSLGMKYPIDVLYLDKDNTILKLISIDISVK